MRNELSIFEQTESALHEWRAFRRRAAARLNMPTASPISRMIERVKVFEQQHKGVRAKKPLKRSKLVRKDPNADAKAVSLEIRHSDAPESALHESLPARRPLEWPAEAMRVEAGVNSAEREHRKILIRSYLYQQSDSKAAQDMRITKQHYRLMRLAAVVWLGEYLQRRGAFPLAKGGKAEL